MKELYLAGGPYYGIQEVFSRIYGVTETVAGFANSGKENPTKKEVADG
ncbi:MAG: peptide-methionine (S)-S-oxide reductase, partial [Dialister sp.]|nr:peptide-methionine (S)-S-oxide reductase [Dialister sp.]